MANITILGSGGFGISLAVMADKFGHKVNVWSAFENEIETLKNDGEHKKLLPGIKINESIGLYSDPSCVYDSDIIIFVVPSTVIRKIAKLIAPHIPEKATVVICSKGLEEGSCKTLSTVVEEEIKNNIVVLSGPSHAEEIALGIPTTIVAASKHKESAYFIQDELSNETLRIYVNDDVMGCELGGSLKNIIALCAGICDGLGFGDNTKAALMTRGLTEIARLGVALGGRTETFSGLTGIGDLIVTCTSMHSRNRRCGILIGKGVKPQDAVAQTGTVEGYTCAKVAYELSKKADVEMPIVEQLNNVLFKGKDVKQSIIELMGRPKKHETEVTWL